jgi:hypothetical protein
VNKKHRTLMEDLKGAKPTLPPEMEDWAESPSAKRVLAQILATEVAPKKLKKGRRPWATRGVAWGALAVVLIGAAAFLAVHFLTGSGKEDVVSHPTTTSSVTPGAGSVTVEEALSQIIALAKATPTIAQGQQGGSAQQGVVEEAGAWGLLRSSESATLQLDQPATRKQFALWLWRCFGQVLPEGTETATVSDLGNLTPEEQQAVKGLVQDGVIQLPEDGAFGGDQVLTPTEELALLARVEALL